MNQRISEYTHIAIGKRNSNGQTHVFPRHLTPPPLPFTLGLERWSAVQAKLPSTLPTDAVLSRYAGADTPVRRY